ncbi:Isochorismatase hydrolase [Mollisia scopiformis]|uniref:Isochorismatase hydrolase n=1 Tax=Mollisia scopiformis TaxID=149040 RepID=A0A194XTM9_MOLSC|nr:Isochorismatase hydrolase [Mollisia scopiformis]KUJ23496.1 Isochorismatase hydrolase [Mollisia scopiformis]
MARPINKSQAAFLLLDYQNMVIKRANASESFVTNAARTIATGRENGLPVVHCRSAFQGSEFADVPSTNLKTRVGHFLASPSTSMHTDLQDKGINTLIIGGLVTQGAVLTTVREAADLDYCIYVVEDMCLDFDAEVHRVLMEKVFPRQAYVIKSEDLDGLLK